jgi:hypothetical protein
MPSIPLDVLLEILKHVRKADLATLCRVSKICCSYSQDVLYREIEDGDADVIPTLAQSTDLARRVRSFATRHLSPELATALRNMSSLRSLSLNGDIDGDESILDGCTFKLETFSTIFPDAKWLRQFLNSQPSLTDVSLSTISGPMFPFDERCLPNLTRVSADLPWLSILIPGRPVKEITMLSYLDISSTNLSSFALSTAPIQRLWIDYYVLYPKSVSLLVSIFPSVVDLVVYNGDIVRVPLCLSI